MRSTLWSEIQEQPDVLRRLLAEEGGRLQGIARTLGGRDIRYILIAARGSSDNAARYGQYLFGARNRLVVALATPSLFSIYHKPPRLEGALVLGISQSGQSPDIVSVLEEARRQGAMAIAITNQPGSPLARAATESIPLHAGRERSVAATKTYTAQLAVLALLSACLEGGEQAAAALQQVPGWMAQALDCEPQVEAAARALEASDHCAVLGRGFNYATIFEIALKIKELAGVEAAPYSSADFMHGPIALAAPGYPVLMVAAGGAVREELASLAGTLRERQARLVMLGDDPGLSRPGDLWVPLPREVPEWLTPLVAVIPGQLLAFHLARRRGLDPDRPPQLRKVTRTR